MDIGDVGIITSDGDFDFLFSICLPSRHPINSGRVPPGFMPLKLDRRRDVAKTPDIHSPGSDIASTSVRMKTLGSDIEHGGGGRAFPASSIVSVLNFDSSDLLLVE